jgi:hypothetical protein
MAKPRREKTREEKASTTPPIGEQRVLPMQLQIGDRLVDETGEYEVIGRPYTTAAGKNARVRVKRVDDPDVTMIRSWAAHERVNVKRTRGAASGVRGIAMTATSSDRRIQNLGNDAEKLARLEGLRDEGDAAGAAQFVRVLGSCGGESDHGDSLRSRISFQALQNVQAIEPRQVIVEKNQVKMDAPRHIEAMFAVRGEEYLIACPAEQSRHDFEHLRLIVDGQDRKLPIGRSAHRDARSPLVQLAGCALYFRALKLPRREAPRMKVIRLGGHIVTRYFSLNLRLAPRDRLAADPTCYSASRPAERAVNPLHRELSSPQLFAGLFSEIGLIRHRPVPCGWVVGLKRAKFTRFRRLSIHWSRPGWSRRSRFDILR